MVCANAVIGLLMVMAVVLARATDMVATAVTDRCLLCFQTIVEATDCHQPSGEEDRIEACFCEIATMCDAVCHDRLRFDPNFVCNSTNEAPPDTDRSTKVTSRGDASKTRFVPSLTRFCNETGLVDCLLPLPPNTDITVEQFFADRETSPANNVKRGHRGNGRGGRVGWCGPPGVACGHAETGEIDDDEPDSSTEFVSPIDEENTEREDPNVDVAAGGRRGDGQRGGAHRNPFGWCGSPDMVCYDEEEGEDINPTIVDNIIEPATAPDSTDKRDDLNIAAGGRHGDGGGGGAHRNPFGWCGSPYMVCYDVEDGADQRAETTVIEPDHSSDDTIKRDDLHVNPVVDNPDLCGMDGKGCAHNADHQGHALPTQEVTVSSTPIPDKTSIFTTVVYHTLVEYTTIVDEMNPMKRPVSIFTTASTATVTEVEGSHLFEAADITGSLAISAHTPMHTSIASIGRVPNVVLLWMAIAVIGMLV